MKPVLLIAGCLTLGIPLLLAGRSTGSGSGERSGGPMSPATALAFVPVPGMTPQRGADTGSLREVIIGIRGANPIQCELLLQAFTGWTSNVPDRDSQAWVVSRRLWQRVENPEDIAWLGEQVRGTDPCASRAAIRVLGRSPSSAARSFLLSGLADPDPTVRRLAAFGIGFREDSTANAQLVRLLRDGDAGVRAAAAWALGAVN